MPPVNNMRLNGCTICITNNQLDVHCLVLDDWECGMGDFIHSGQENDGSVDHRRNIWMGRGVLHGLDESTVLRDARVV